MEYYKLSVFSVVGSGFCIEAEEGEAVYEQIIKAFKNEKKVELSFLNVEMTTTAFLNTAVGQLLKDYEKDFIKKNLKVVEASNRIAIRLVRVVDTAEDFYKNPDLLKKSLEDFLFEEE